MRVNNEKAYKTERLTKILIASLVVYGLTLAGLLFAEWSQLGLLNSMSLGEHFDDEELLAMERRVGLWALLYLLVFFVTIIFFLRWTFITKKRAATFTRQKFEISPGWSVGWYFIPVAWLWKPYQAIKETFHASAPAELTKNHSFATPAILPIWWALWLVSSVMGNISAMFGMRPQTIGDVIFATKMTLFAHVLGILVTVAAIAVVRLLHEWQSQKQPLQAEPPAADLTIGSVM